MQTAGYLTPKSQDHDIGLVAGYINLYNPGHIANGQYTNSRIRIKTGNSGQMDIIEAGWTVITIYFTCFRIKNIAYLASDS